MTFSDGWWYAWHPFSVPTWPFFFGWAIATMLVFEGLRAVNALGLWMVDVVWAFLTQRDIQ